MGKKKKKMTKAQAAAARREGARPKYQPLPDSVKDSGPRDSTNRTAIIVAAVTITIAIALSAVFAFPQMMGQ